MNAATVPSEFIYLASTSPRRRALLEQIGVRFELLLPGPGEDAEALARAHGTPLFVYDRARYVENSRRFQAALAGAGLDFRLRFALKANPMPEILEVVRGLGAPGTPASVGIDACSPGEVIRALEYGMPPTGGIGIDDLTGYLRLSSVLAVGGTWLAPRDRVDAGDFEAIARDTRAATSLVGRLP